MSILSTGAIPRNENENPKCVHVPKDINATGAAPSADPRLYVPKDTKRKKPRRTKAAIGSVRDAIKEILEESNPQTVRQVFYALTVRGVIAKAEIEYKRTVVRLLVEMPERGEIPFEWLAVTREQVEQWNLPKPTQPTKQTDSRAKKFGSPTSVELDAVPAAKLRELVRNCIERHIDQEQLKILKVAEESERDLLKKWASTHAGSRS
jgi:hypothetical protein